MASRAWTSAAGVLSPLCPLAGLPGWCHHTPAVRVPSSPEGVAVMARSRLGAAACRLQKRLGQDLPALGADRLRAAES